jgi:hypothetical protein
MKKSILYIGLIIGLGFLSACNNEGNKNGQQEQVNYEVKKGTNLDIYANIELKTDISHLSTVV